MLMERNLVWIGAIFAVVITVATALALLATRGIFDRGHELVAEFRDAAGLTPDDHVLVAGVRSGRVTSVELNGDVVEVGFIVNVDLPRDTRAQISVQNLLGRRQLVLVAGADWDDLLRDGDVITTDRTRTPVDVPEFGEETEALARETDEVALQAIVTALADITEGQREQVADLLDGLERVAGIVHDRRDELEQAINRTEAIFAAFRDRDTEIVRIIDAFGSTLDMLVDRRADTEQLLRETADASELLATLVSTERARIDRVLPSLHDTLRHVDATQVDIAHFFAYSGVALEGFASVGYSGDQDNPFWANMRVQDFGPAGVDALFGCGGIFDRALDEVFGADPRSCEQQDALPVPGEAAQEPAEQASASSGSMRRLFQLHDVHVLEVLRR